MLAFVKKEAAFGGELMEWPEPSIQNANEVLIEVKACAICGSDVHFYEWPKEIHDQLVNIVRFPRVLGREVAGVLKEVGKEVRDFQVGDRVVCETWGGCGFCYYCRLGRFNHCLYKMDRWLSQKVDGGMAEYFVAPSLSLHKFPESISFDEASVVEPMGVALHALERSHFKPGDDLAVIGPGPIGLLGVMIGQAMGAGRVFVLGLEVDKERLRVASSLGAWPIVVNQEGFADEVLQATDGRGVDAVLDTSGGTDSIHNALKVLKQGGEILELGIGAPFTFDYVQLVRREALLIGSFRSLPLTWLRAINLIANRKVDVGKIITHRLPLQKVKEGFAILKQRRGLKVILNP